ncbi:tumor suppressor candidate 2-like [Diadema setosum]|uniref:tumor suppressor candidate 2-like n=1 Tax=Diadema setosum TaxID=31175 RepID=UPI003B3B2913
MGSRSSSLMQKVVSPVSQYMGYGHSTVNDNTDSGSEASENGRPFKVRKLANPFVLTRTSSMYIDEDGQVAHEFYEEAPAKSKKNGRRRVGMKRIYRNIVPQGEVPVDPPRLRGEIPAVMWELRSA